MSSLKKRAESIYKSKLANYIKSVKELSSVPKIDSLSKKIAEVATIKELEALGIKPSEKLPKKVFYTIPEKTSVNIQHISIIIPSDLDEVYSPSVNMKKNLLNSTKENFEEHQKPKQNNLKSEKTVILDLKVPLADPGPYNSTGKWLNSSKNGKSEKTEKNPFSYLPENKLGKTFEPIKPSVSTPKASMDMKKMIKPNSNENLSNQFNETNNLISNAFSKASLWHSVHDLASTAISRSHVNLPGSQASPVYYNARTKKESELKASGGQGFAKSRRSDLLKGEEIKEIGKNDFGSRNERWVRMKQEKLKKLKDDREMKELEDFSQNCTFDPRLKRRKYEQKSSGYNFSLNLYSPNFNETEKLEGMKKGPAQYVGLSPSIKEIRYIEGCNTEKLLKLGKPMISYT